MSGDGPVAGGAAEGDASDAAAVRGGADVEAGSATGDGSVDEAGTDVDARGGGQTGSGSEDGSGPRLVIRRRGRRVTTEPVAGYTGEPPLERQQSNENDARLKGDVPPHWG